MSLKMLVCEYYHKILVVICLIQVYPPNCKGVSYL